MISNLVNKKLQRTYFPISHEVKTTRQGNWSFNTIYEEKCFSSKIGQKMRQETSSRSLFFLKKKKKEALYEVKASGL